MAWDKYGVWTGHVEQENGEWLIGDHLPEDHPGHVSKDDPRGLMVKYWTASAKDKSRKYLGSGHEPPLPAHGGRLEGVQVLSGWFRCECQDITRKLGRGCDKRKDGYHDCIELGPDKRRRWFLYRHESTFVSGVTICRHMDKIPERFGSGSGYFYTVLDTTEVEPDAWPDLLRYPLPLVDAARPPQQLIMVFRGILLCERPGEMVTHQLAACSTFSRGYAYTSPNIEGDWRPVNTMRTIVAVVRY